MSETMTLLQYIHIQSHPTRLSVTDQDADSISPHSIPSYTPFCQRPGYCFNISTFNPILHTYLSENMILFQYLHIQSHPAHISVRDHDTASISPHSIPSYTPICQRPGYCFNISTFNPIIHTYLSETMILLQYLHIQSHPSHPTVKRPGHSVNISTFNPILHTLFVRDHDTVSISPHSIPSYTLICHRPGNCFNISTFNPILHNYLSETRILYSISPHSIPFYTPICQRPRYCFNISTFNPILHPYLSEWLKPLRLGWMEG